MPVQGQQPWGQHKLHRKPGAVLQVNRLQLLQLAGPAERQIHKTFDVSKEGRNFEAKVPSISRQDVVTPARSVTSFAFSTPKEPLIMAGFPLSGNSGPESRLDESDIASRNSKSSG